MTDQDGFIHPYVPNAAPGPRQRLLDAVGLASVKDLYASIPENLQFKGGLDLPASMPGEYDLRRHVEGILSANKSTRDFLNFRGAGCWQHFIPAICDEIVHRGEFLTSYAGGTYSDHGKNQAIFEYQSMLGELVGMEVVTPPTYDWGAAADSAVAACGRLTGRRGVLVPELMSPERLSQMRGFTKPHADIRTVRQDPATGLLDLDDLAAKLGDDIGAVYFENPAYIGTIETQGAAIAEAVHGVGALVVVGVDPITLGVLAPPADYGADFVVGDLQPLGIHMFAGGGCAGFTACRDEARFVAELPTTLVSATPTGVDGEIGFAWSTMERTAYDTRHEATDYYGTTQWLWGIGAAVYLSLLGPKGMVEIGEGVMQRARYAAGRLGEIASLSVLQADTPVFKEFVVSFGGAGKSVADVNAALMKRDIVGGHDLSTEFPALGQAMLVCVTEVHSKDDIDTLVDVVREAVQ